MECFSEETKSLLESSGQLRPELYRQKAKQRILDLEHEVAQRIRLLKDEIWALQVSRNDGIPIALLPAEILSKIFLEVAFLTLANSALPGQEKVTWIHLTHVCHQWRIVALNCPSLWSLITLTGSITMTRIMLARSKKHSLTVTPPKHLNLLKPQGRWESLNLALLETNRLRAIELNSDFNGVEPQHLEVAFQGKDLPILEKLVLTSSGSSHRIPQKFLQSSRTPTLKHLEVVGYIILWDPLPSATGLTFLKLHHSFAIEGERPPEKLLFKAVGPNASPPVSRPVPLPSPGIK
ncbi:hypothetical protein DFP72DRAFT_11795 [Ephemerocybe angulata]|uniref:F-box domain-containing protein n=1 Tax=Ephemerocybe angulata TaxID=980116 RepID=A0A8H6MGU0_9AGAR|nr:hypothetical protein DFP72DRAFT_11795 [Tulosesus angulatus]